MDEVLNVQEVAQLLKLEPSQIRELTRTRSQLRSKHPLPFCRVGRVLRFRRSAIDSWLSQLEAEPKAA